MFHLKMQPNISFTVLSVIFFLSSTTLGSIIKEKSYSQIEPENQTNTGLSVENFSADLEMPNEKKMTRLSIFDVFFRTELGSCPCLLEIGFVDFEDSQKRGDYLDFVELAANPLEIEEITDSYLEIAIAHEVEVIKTRYLETKKETMNELKNRKEALLEEITVRALESIWKEILYVIRNGSVSSEQIDTSLSWIQNRVQLLVKMKRSSRLEELATRKFDGGMSDYVSHFNMNDGVKSKLNEALWGSFSKEVLNKLAQETMSVQGDLSPGSKLIMKNGTCLESESQNPEVRYLRFMDFISTEQSQTDLYDRFSSDVIWVFPGLLTMRYFDALFTGFDEENSQKADFLRIYSKLYAAVAWLRAKNSEMLLSSNDEAELLKILLSSLSSDFNGKDLFTNENEKEEYLLLKTIIYQRVISTTKLQALADDKLEKDMITDFGLPLRFYVFRKSDRKLLKKLVKVNNLNVNLNILRYYIDELKTDEEFQEKAQNVFFNYLNGIFADETQDKEEIEEIYENLEDLYVKMKKDCPRRQRLISLGIRYVYFKYHFNFVYGLEEMRNGTAIVNASRMDRLRKILDIVFLHIDDSSDFRANSIFKAVEMGDESFASTYDDIKAFWKNNAALVLKYIKKFAGSMEPSVYNEIWSLVEFDFHQFLNQDEDAEAFKSLNQILSSELTDFKGIISFRQKYFIEMIRLLSLAKSFRYYQEKSEEKMEYIRVYIYSLLFRAFGTRPEAAKYHLALEYDYFMSSEVNEINILKKVESIFVTHQKEYYDVVKINNLRNLVSFPSLLSKVRFNFIFFKKVAAVLRFFDLKLPSNSEFLAVLNQNFGPHPHFYHFNNIMFLLNLQKEIDVKEEITEQTENQTPESNTSGIMQRLAQRFVEANDFDASRIPSDHERSIVLASKIAVVYFYAIYLQTCDDYGCKKEERGSNWPVMNDFLKSVLDSENQRVRIYFFTDYLYENMNTSLFADGYENVEYNQESFIKAAESNAEKYPKYVVNRRKLVSWGYEHLKKLKYFNSHARFFENTVYDFYKELIRNHNFDKAEELTSVMIENTLAFHRRNGHKVLNDWLRNLLSSIINSPKLPEHRQMDLVMFNCVSEFVADMNSPNMKYHDFQPGPVKVKLIQFIFRFFKEKGKLQNKMLHMPAVDLHLDIGRYTMVHLVSMFSLLDLDLTQVMKAEVMEKHTNTAEFLSWRMFTPEKYLTAIDQFEGLSQGLNKKAEGLKKLVKSHNLNNYTNQNLEGYFQPLCHFEDAMISARFIEQDIYMSRLEKTIPECLNMIRKAAPLEARKILFEIVKVFFMPDKYFKANAVIFEDDELSPTLVRVKKLFVSVLLTAKEAVPFFEFAQIMQKILSAQAKVVNTNFQSFFTKLVSLLNVDELSDYLNKDAEKNRLLDIPDNLFESAKISPKLVNGDNSEENDPYREKMKKFYINSTIYDVLTLIPINQNTFTKDENWLWNLDLFHLLNRKSNFASYITNLFQNYNELSKAAFSHFYFLLNKFKLTRMLEIKAEKGSLKRDSNPEHAVGFTPTPRSQDALTNEEAPRLNDFLGDLMTHIKASGDKNISIIPNEELLDHVYYFKMTNIDINIVDMTVFEESQDYAVSLVKDIRKLLKGSETLPTIPKTAVLKANLGDDPGLSNNLSFYYQEVSKLNSLIERYGEIDDKFEHSKDEDVKGNYKGYINRFISLFEGQFGLQVSPDKTIMYHRDLSTMLFKFKSNVVF